MSALNFPLRAEICCTKRPLTRRPGAMDLALYSQLDDGNPPVPSPPLVSDHSLVGVGGTRPLPSQATRRAFPPHDKHHHSQNDEYDQQDLGNPCCLTGDPAESEHGCDDRHNEEDQCITEHVAPRLTWSGLSRPA